MSLTEFKNSSTFKLSEPFYSKKDVEEQQLALFDVWMFFEPLCELVLTDDKPPNINWRRLLIQAFSKLEGHLGGEADVSKKAMIAKHVKQLVELMILEMSTHQPEEEFRKTIEEAIGMASKIRSKEEYQALVSIDTREVEKVQSIPQKPSGTIRVVSPRAWATLCSNEKFFEFLLDLMPGRDLLLEAISKGQLSDPIQCQKTTQLELAYLFLILKSKEILEFQFVELSKMLVVYGDESKLIAKRIEQLAGRCVNSKDDRKARLAKIRVDELLTILNPNPGSGDLEARKAS